MSEKHAIDAAWAELTRADGLIVSDGDQIRFTGPRKEDLRSLFAIAGFDIEKIRSRQQYAEARKKASEVFPQWIRQIAGRGTMTQERRLLMKIVNGE